MGAQEEEPGVGQVNTECGVEGVEFVGATGEGPYALGLAAHMEGAGVMKWSEHQSALCSAMGDTPLT